ncbi:MAG: hypothetical protein ACLP9Y_29295, partial [Mycobacterium sp.]
MLTPPTEQVRRQMQAQKTTGTKIELRVRRGLHARGYRYRVDRRLWWGQTWRHRTARPFPRPARRLGKPH